MELTLDIIEDIHVGRVTGRLETSVSEDFRVALERVLRECPGPVVLDLEGVGFIASACLGAMVGFRQNLGDDRVLIITGLSVPIHKMFKVASFDRIFQIASTTDEAVSLLNARPQ
jgi:anti-sigma B factor antagonist